MNGRAETRPAALLVPVLGICNSKNKVLFQRKAKGIPAHVTEVMERLEGRSNLLNRKVLESPAANVTNLELHAYLSAIVKLSVAVPSGRTLTVFSQVCGGVNTGR